MSVPTSALSRPPQPRKAPPPPPAPVAASHSLTQASGRPRHTLLIDRQDAEFWLAADSLLAQKQSPPVPTVEHFPRPQQQQQQHRPKYALAPSLPVSPTSRVAIKPAYARQRVAHTDDKIGLGLDLASSSSSSSGTPSQAMMTPSHSSSSSSYLSSPARHATKSSKRKSGLNEFEAHTAALRKLYPASPVHVSPRGRRPAQAPPVTTPLTTTATRNSALSTGEGSSSVRSQSQQSTRQLVKRKMVPSTSDTLSTRSPSTSSVLAAAAAAATPVHGTSDRRPTLAHDKDVFESPRPAPPAPRSSNYMARPLAGHKGAAFYESPSQSLASMSQGEQTPSSSPASVLLQNGKAKPRTRRPLQPALAAAAALSAAAGTSTSTSTSSLSSSLSPPPAAEALASSPNLSIHPGSSLLHATPRFDVGHAAFDISMLHNKHSSPTLSPSVYTQDSPAIQETMMSSFPDPPHRSSQSNATFQGAARARSPWGTASSAASTKDGSGQRGKPKPLPPPPPPTEPLPRAPKSAMEPVPKAILPKIRPFRSREELRAWSMGIGQAATLPDTPQSTNSDFSEPRKRGAERLQDSSTPCTSNVLDGSIYAAEPSTSQKFTSSEPDLLSQLTREVQSAAEGKARSRFVERLSQDGKYASMIRCDDAFESPMLTSDSEKSSEPAFSGMSSESKAIESLSSDEAAPSASTMRIKLGGSLSPGSNGSHTTGILLSPVKAKMALEEVKTDSLQRDFVFPATNRVTFASLPKPEHVPAAPAETSSVFSGPLRWLPNVRSNSRSSASKFSGRWPLSPSDDVARPTPTGSLVTTSTDSPTTPTAMATTTTPPSTTKKALQHNRNASSKSSTASSAVSCTFTHKSNLSTSTAASSHDAAHGDSSSLYTASLDGHSPTRRTAELASADGTRKTLAKAPPSMNAIPEASPHASFTSRMEQQTPVSFEVMASPPMVVKRDCASAQPAPPAPPRRSSAFASLDAAKIHERAARRMQALVKQERNSGGSENHTVENNDIETLTERMERQSLDGTQTGELERSPNLDSSEAHYGMTSLPSFGTLDLAARDRWSSLISNPGDDFSSIQNHGGSFAAGFGSSVNAEDMHFIKSPSSQGPQPFQQEHFGIAL